MESRKVVRSAVLGLSLLSVCLNAQDVVGVAQSGVQQNISSSAPRITAHFDKTIVEDALHEIARQANYRLVYERTRLPLNTRVSANFKNVAVNDALSTILKSTGASARIAADGETILVIPAVKNAGQRSQGVITGKVTDSKTGRGVPGASISIDADGRTVSTGEEGSYRLVGVAPGNHVVTVRLVGYAKQARSVMVGDGAAVTVDFKLEPSANVLDQVIVTGTVAQTELKAVPNAITVITAKQIEERGITRIDQLFRGEIPGLFALNLGANAQLDQVTMFSRGATALSNTSVGTQYSTNPIKTYIDGVEMADPQYLSQIDPKSIERIEVLTGPQASTIYGSNAINGVMQIFTKRGSTSKPQAILSLTSGVAENNFSNGLAASHVANLEVSGVEGHWSYNVGGSYNHAGAWTPGKQTERFSANGGARMDMGKLTGDISARRGLTKNKQMGGGSPQAWTHLTDIGVLRRNSRAVSFPQAQSLNGETFGLTLKYNPFSWWSHEIVMGADAESSEDLTTAYAYSSVDDTSLRITTSTTSRTKQSYSSTAQIPLSGFANVSLVAGADHWRARNSSWNSQNTLSLTGTISNVNLTRNHPDKNSGAFLQGQLALRDVLFMTYGLRFEWNPGFGEDANPNVAPRYGVSYVHNIGPILAKLRGSYGRSTRPALLGLSQGAVLTDVNFTEQYGKFYYILPNADLGPEHQQGGEGGIELYIGNYGSLVVTRYNQTVDNLIYQVFRADSARSLTGTPNSSYCFSSFRDDEGHCYAYQSQFINVGSIRNQGWDLQGSINTGPFTTRGTYSWSKSRVLGITPRYRALLTGFTRGSTFKFMAEHTWHADVRYAHRASTVSLDIDGTGMLYKQYDKVFNSLDATQYRFRTLMPRVVIPDVYRPLGSGYAMANLNAMHRFTARVDATLQIRNLADYYQNDYDANSATVGRQTSLGLRIKL